MRYWILALALALACAAPASAAAPVVAPGVSVVLHATLTAAQKEVIVQAAFQEALIILDRAGLESTENGRLVMLESLRQGLETILSRNDMLSMSDGDAAAAALAAVTAAMSTFAGAAAGVDRIGGTNGGGLKYLDDYIFSGESTAGEFTGATCGLVVAFGVGVAIGTVMDKAYTQKNHSSIGEDVAAHEEAKDQADLDAAVQAAHEEAQQREREREEQATGHTEDTSATGTSENPDTPPAPPANPADPENPPTDSSNNSGNSGMPNPENDHDSGHVVNKPSAPGTGVSTPNPNADPKGNGIDPTTGKPYPVNQPGNGTDAPDHKVEGAHFMHEDLINILSRGMPPLILFTPDLVNRLNNIPLASLPR